MPPRKTILRIIFIFVAVGVAGFFAWKKLQGPVVEVARAQAGPFEHSIVVSGRVQAPNRIEIGAVITGRVDKVLVEEGALVTAGQPLIVLETSELKAALDQARAAEASSCAIWESKTDGLGNRSNVSRHRLSPSRAKTGSSLSSTMSSTVRQKA